MLRSCVGWSCGPSDDLEDIPVLRVCYWKAPKGTPAAWPVMYLSGCLVPSAASSPYRAPVLSPLPSPEIPTLATALQRVD